MASEYGGRLPGTLVVNSRTEKKTYTNEDGIFIIQASARDELRFAREGFDRTELVIDPQYFSQPLRVILFRQEQLIPELVMGFVPTGKLKRDVEKLDTPYQKKVAAINKDLNVYMKSQPKVVLPSMKYSGFRTNNIRINYVDVIGLAKGVKMLINKVSKTSKEPISPVEREKFYDKVKVLIDKKYFANIGFKDYDFDALLSFADKRYALAENYYYDFDIKKIHQYLRISAKEYLRESKPSLFDME
ncbi:MAG: hypothetical protein FDW93_02295 [Bergeyella sp.]|nr:hypothetical protein [Bergeyella sp.]